MQYDHWFVTTKVKSRNNGHRGKDIYLAFARHINDLTGVHVDIWSGIQTRNT